MKRSHYYFTFLLLLILHFSGNAQAYLYRTAVVTGTVTTSGSVTTGGSNRYLMVFVHYKGVSITSVTYNAVALTAGVGSAGATYKTASYYMSAPASGTHTLNVTVSGTGSFYATAMSFAYVSGFSWSGIAAFTNLTNTSTGGLSVGARDMVLAAVTSSAGTISEAAPTINVNNATSPLKTCDSRLGVGVSNAITWNFSSSSSGDIVYYIMTGVNALPVELLNFSADALIDRTVKTDWTTSSQTNNDYFTIERSTDAVHFEPVGTINGAGTTSRIQNYSFVDHDPSEGLSYYRLRQTDYDGKTEVFQMKAVNLQKESESLQVVIHANAVNDGNLGIYVSDPRVTTISMQITGITGEIIYYKDVQLPGSQLIELNDLGQLVAGTYFVTVGDQYERKTERFMVIR